MNNINTKILTILFSLIPISIILGPSISLINIVIFSLYFLIIYFSKNNIKIYDLKTSFSINNFKFVPCIQFINFSRHDTSGIYRNFGFLRSHIFFCHGKLSFFINKGNEKSSEFS